MNHSYMFSLSYADRTREIPFIKDILKQYNENELIGAGAFVNNNPYNFQFLLYLNFSEDVLDFEKWLLDKHPNKKRMFNYFSGDIFKSISSKGYNCASFLDENSVDFIISSTPNEIFLFPEKALINSKWNNDIIKDTIKIFLSHSSKDKPFVDKIFKKLQSYEFRAWYDKYEISPGDSIVDKINDGLSNSDIGLICISNNFLNSSTGWTKSELNYFIQKNISTGKNNFICLNFDVPHQELPPLIQEYMYINMNDENAIDLLITMLTRQFTKR